MSVDGGSMDETSTGGELVTDVCVRCGEPCVRLIAEPDLWLCDRCSDAEAARATRPDA